MENWRSQFPVLWNRLIPRMCYSKQSFIVNRELHGFSDALETADVGAVYLRAVDSTNGTEVSLVITKTKVVLIKRLTIPHLD